MKTRVIPVLLVRDNGLVKTVRFKTPRYVGDPINSVRIFNDKEVDELAFIDIGATPAGRGPDFALLERIAGEAFMPMAYGGGITRLDEVERILSLGFEKVIFGAALFDRPDVVAKTSAVFGTQATVACLDVKKTFGGKHALFTHSGARRRAGDPAAVAAAMERLGVGEILVNSIDRDGTMIGYDIDLVRRVAAAVSAPLITLGGAGAIEHFREAVMAGASAVAAGSMFVYKGVHRAVLINYPERRRLEAELP